MRLLIAEDELDLAEVLTVFFEKNHFAVDTVNNGFDAYEYGITGNYDAIILDVMMPKMNGIEVLQKLRAEHCETPIMMLTAKGETDDRIIGFNAGADDYLPKPFAPDELISRVRAMLRRSEAYHPTLLFVFRPYLRPRYRTFNMRKREPETKRQGVSDYGTFMRNPNQVFSAERIMIKVWGWDNDAEINVVWVNISNLRKKLKSVGSKATLTANRGLGYLLEDNS